jgi:hypothetical protein
MNKLYYIVCDDKDTNVFEGRYQGRTRGEALKFLKQSLGRKSLNGLVFTITEIPVPLIREIVAEILAGGGVPAPPAPNIVPLRHPEAEQPVGRFDAFADATEVTVTSAEPEPTDKPETAPAPVKQSKSKPKSGTGAKVGNPGHGDDFWAEVRAYWLECRNTRLVAEKFGISRNTVKTRSLREGWNK